MLRLDNEFRHELLQKDDLLNVINDILNAFALVSPERFRERGLQGILGLKEQSTFTRDGVSYLLLVFNDLDSRLFFDSHKEVVESDILRPDQTVEIHRYLFENVVIPLLWPRLRARKTQSLEFGTATFSRLNQGIGVTATVAVPSDQLPDEVIAKTRKEVWDILDGIYIVIFPKMVAELSVYLDRIRNGRCVSCNMQGPPLCPDCS